MRTSQPQPAATIEERLDAIERSLERVARQQEELLRLLGERGRPRLDGLPALCSLSQAAAALGRSRRTLRGKLRTVRVGKARLVPAVEVQRVAAEGLAPEPVPAKKRARKTASAGDVAGRIAAIKID